ncbi:MULTISPECIES: hypothetical protein [unclassified Streptomyces]|uniref:hypothetical protein n=1 Tax=unclassified Streptomyces TaxID=2593676 RepID=UPI00037B0755|nr:MULTISPECIES: hypothetical protein [unclassified Streptomyces]MYT27373.1 hypothetical protein [Streptomyces sp. SID8354]
MRLLNTKRIAPAPAVAAMLLGAAFPLVGPTVAADASVLDLSCRGATQVTYDPGLTLTPQRVHFHAVNQLTSCTSPKDPTLTSSQPYIIDGDLVLSCGTPLDNGPATQTITWNNGRSSTFTGSFTTSSVGGVLVDTFVGKVTAGEFQGDSAELVFDESQRNMAQCAQPGGLKRESGVLSLTVQEL